LARAIRGHPTITCFQDNGKLPYESLDTLYSVLATLTALEEIRLSKWELSRNVEDKSALANAKSLTELLQVPTSWFVDFRHFSFTPALCQATANAFREGTSITNLEFWNCYFPGGECAVTSISVVLIVGGALYNALAAALPLTSTLQELFFKLTPSSAHPDAHVDRSPIFSAM
jgi:hypothetical protein